MKNSWRHMTNPKQIEAEGFWLGTQRAAVDAALRKFTAVFAQHVAKTTARFEPRIKKLEAKANILNELRQNAAALWTKFDSATNGQEPQMLLPLMAFVVSFLLWLGETYLIAPVLDGMGISEPIEQKLVAGVVVLAAATLLEVATHLYRTENSSFILRVICFLLSGATLIFLGWWRGAELIYSAALGSGALKSFLSQTEGLTTIVVTLLTIILPVGATLALDWGLTQARFGWSWRKARKANKRFSASHEHVARKLEAIRIERDQECSIWEQRREECANAFLQAYELGRTIGARRLPFRLVLQKILAVGVLLVACVLLAAYSLIDAGLAQPITSDLARLAIYLLFGAGATGIYSAHVIKAWHRPSALQLYEERGPIWRDEAQIEVERSARAQNDWLSQASVPAVPGTRTPDEEIAAAINFDDDETTRVSVRAA